MVRNALTISMDAEGLSVSAFIRAADETVEILRELDSAISMRRRGTLKWLIHEMHYGSPATMTIRGAAASEERDFGQDVVDAYFDGIQQIQDGKGLPPLFSDDSLEPAKRLGRLASAGILQFHNSRYQLQITERLAAAVDELVGETYSEGSLDGRLEMVTLYGRPYFRVYDLMHGWGIPCSFNPEHIEAVRDNVGKRVLVTGRMRMDQRGTPLDMRTTNLASMPEDAALPYPSEIRGIARGMTEGLTAEEYLRRLRGDGSE